MRHRSRAFGALILAGAAGLPALAAQAGAPSGTQSNGPASGPAGADVSATVSGLRSAKGRVLACLTGQPAAFPDCAHDPHAFTASVPAATSVSLEFHDVPPGHYAISLFHDENGNGHLDTRMMIPREGYGFSRDAPVRFGPPPFARAAFAVGAQAQHQAIRMRYIF